MAWLRLPPPARDGRVAVLPTAQAHVGAATVNRKLSAVAAFYAHQARHGVDVGELLTTWAPGRRGGWKPFLHHVSKGQPAGQRGLIASEGAEEAAAGAHRRRRCRRSWTPAPGCGTGCCWRCCAETGMRVGEALGLRHEDIEPPPSQVSVVPAAQRQRRPGQVRPATGDPGPAARVVRLYADYLHAEYGDLDSDYVFVNLFAEPRGQALSYPAVYDLVLRLRRRTGIDFDPHWMRHTAATRLLRDGVPVEVVAELLGHASVATTIVDLRAPDRRGRAPGAGGGGLVHRGRGELVTGRSTGRVLGLPGRRSGRSPACCVS